MFSTGERIKKRFLAKELTDTIAILGEEESIHASKDGHFYKIIIHNLTEEG
ncbi:MAG: hypothetical protein K1X55_17775 [Chitinophagales bacterium]|nr:hypothetical protein [Chitinophagales bacterium]